MILQGLVLLFSLHCIIPSLQYGADINAEDHDGWSPLAILNADREVFKESLSESGHSWWTLPLPWSMMQ